CAGGTTMKGGEVSAVAASEAAADHDAATLGAGAAPARCPCIRAATAAIRTRSAVSESPGLRSRDDFVDCEDLVAFRTGISVSSSPTSWDTAREPSVATSARILLARAAK